MCPWPRRMLDVCVSLPVAQQRLLIEAVQLHESNVMHGSCSMLIACHHGTVSYTTYIQLAHGRTTDSNAACSGLPQPGSRKSEPGHNPSSKSSYTNAQLSPRTQRTKHHGHNTKVCPQCVQQANVTNPLSDSTCANFRASAQLVWNHCCHSVMLKCSALE